nr:hypothetical protein CFP56_41322 [Quercus suber]
MAMSGTTSALAESQRAASTNIPPLTDGWHIRHNMPTRRSAGLLRYDSEVPVTPRLRPSPLVAMAREYVRSQWASTTVEESLHAAQKRRTAIFHRQYKQLRKAEREARARQKSLDQSQQDFLKAVQEENYNFNNDDGHYGYENFLGFLIPEWDAAKEKLFARAMTKFDAINEDILEQTQDVRRQLDRVERDMANLKRQYQVSVTVSVFLHSIANICQSNAEIGDDSAPPSPAWSWSGASQVDFTLESSSKPGYLKCKALQTSMECGGRYRLQWLRWQRGSNANGRARERGMLITRFTSSKHEWLTNVKSTLTLLPIPAKEDFIPLTCSFMQHGHELNMADWVQEDPATDAADRVVPTDHGVLNQPYGCPDAIVCGSTTSSRGMLAGTVCEASPTENVQASDQSTQTRDSSMSLQHDSRKAQPQENRLQSQNGGSVCAQHRLRLDKLKADFTRLQKLEKQALSRLDRIRQMKDQVTERVQVCDVPDIIRFHH